MTGNVFTVDVEEYFQVEAFSDVVRRRDWDAIPSRVEASTVRLLEMMEGARVKGTFFVLGCLAEKHPGLVRRIARGGHEVASHGFDHTMITNMTPERFREDVRKTKRILEDIAGMPVKGYRAPTFSIVKNTAWAHAVLLQEGYSYSSSVFPVWHDRYGWPEFGERPRKAVSDGTDELWEVPLSVGFIGPWRVPFGGGGYLRVYPRFLTRKFLRDLDARGRPLIVYVHPWEIDPDQPAVPAPLLRRLRHRIGIPKTEERLKDLLGARAFGTVARFLEANGHGR